MTKTLWRFFKSMTTGTATLQDPKQKRESFVTLAAKHKEKLLAMTPARDAVLAAANSLKDLEAAVKKVGKHNDDYVVVSNNRKNRPVVV
jgi:hypothetical protein